MPRNRTPKGDPRRLPAAKVAEIRSACAARLPGQNGGMVPSQVELAHQFGVSQSTISQISRGVGPYGRR